MGKAVWSPITNHKMPKDDGETSVVPQKTEQPYISIPDTQTLEAEG